MKVKSLNIYNFNEFFHINSIFLSQMYDKWIQHENDYNEGVLSYDEWIKKMEGIFYNRTLLYVHVSDNILLGYCILYEEPKYNNIYVKFLYIGNKHKFSCIKSMIEQSFVFINNSSFDEICCSTHINNNKMLSILKKLNFNLKQEKENLLYYTINKNKLFENIIIKRLMSKNE